MKPIIISLLSMIASFVITIPSHAESITADEPNIPKANLHYPIVIPDDALLADYDPNFVREVMTDMLAILINFRFNLERNIRHHYVLACCYYTDVTKNQYPSELCCYYMPYPGHQELAKQEVTEMLHAMPSQPFCKKEVKLARDFYLSLADSVLYCQKERRAERASAHKIAAALDHHLLNEVCQLSL